MLTETGRVVAVDEQGLWVETIRQSTCGSCAANKGCGHGLMNRISDSQRGLIRVLPGDCNIRDCNVDDEVRFGIPEDVILRGSVLVYVLPMLSLLAGAAVASQYARGELLVIAGAAMGLLVGFSLVRWHAWRHRHDPALHPVLLGVTQSSVSVFSLS
jgi:sigma-E factor negative regulatory protein RseC